MLQIVLLSNRELKEEAIKNRGDCLIIEKTDAPTAKQVAVVWVQEDGLAPEIHGFLLVLTRNMLSYEGFWISDQAGKMHELKNSSPQLDPCCFPLLHPRGTLGYRWFLKKKGFMVILIGDSLFMDFYLADPRRDRTTYYAAFA